MKKFFVISISVLLAAAFLSSPGFSQRGINIKQRNEGEKRLALVIGNGAYKSSPLNNPVNDARDIAQTLKELGFEVIHKENAGQREMEDVIRDFGNRLKRGGIGLFYFAGHGMQVNGSNYLIPTDADIQKETDIKYEAVDAGRVLDEMYTANNSLNIVILDACRDNPFARSFRTSEKGLAKMDAPTGTLIAYATAPGSVASDGGGRNGLFTKYLMQYMKTPGLKVEDVLKQVRVAVAKETGNRQITWQHSSLMGDFYFTAGDMTVADSGSVTITKPEPEKETVLVIRPDVSDATVWINDEKMGTGALRFKNIQPGIYRIRITRDGYEPYEKRVKVEKGQSQEVAAYLEKIVKPVVERMKPEPVQETVSQGKKITNSLGMEFVYIEAGSFMMGSPENEPGRGNDEKQHKVTLTKGFYMQTTEVTQGQWEAVMGNNPSLFQNCGDDCPVEQVSWEDTQEFIKKLNRKEGTDKYRLPTEAEWEYAARAGTTTPFSFGRCLSTDQANYDGNYPLEGCPKGEYRRETVPVASFAPNAWGLYDMSGNVYEWCSDWYGYYSASADVDPVGAGTGSNRVSRGGDWSDFVGHCRSAYRYGSSPSYRYWSSQSYRNNSYGFRLAFSPRSAR